MVSIFEMVNGGANARFMAEIARQFGISMEQANAGMAALMPAYAQGFQRVMTDPSQFLRLMGMFAQNRPGSAFGQAFTPEGVARGNEILGEIFGTKELSRAVAQQAAAATGLSQTVMKSMLPALAPAILEALFKMLTGFGAPGRASAGDNPFGRMLEQMTGGGASANTGDNPFGKMAKDMMGGGANPWGKVLQDMLGAGQSRPAGADNPFGKMFEDMLRGGLAGPSTGQSGPRGETADKQAGKSLEDLIGGMFETGRTVQRDYQRNMESVFDEFLGGMKKG
jgi:hypothetical protein